MVFIRSKPRILTQQHQEPVSYDAMAQLLGLPPQQPQSTQNPVVVTYEPSPSSSEITKPQPKTKSNCSSDVMGVYLKKCPQHKHKMSQAQVDEAVGSGCGCRYGRFHKH
jgi:hypothetical protein